MSNAPRRIVVYGPSGSGKSTFARELASNLGLPCIELDAIIHSRPDWNDISVEEFREALTARLAEYHDGWVSEGNYFGMVGDIVLPQADLAIWLRLPFHVVYPRLAKRTLSRLVTREELYGGNRERWHNVFGRESMLLWGITAWKPHHRKAREILHERPLRTKLVVLKSPREVRRYLKRDKKADRSTDVSREWLMPSNDFQ